VPKWLEIDQDNLRMKFSALNVDFSSLRPDSVGSRRYPSKNGYLFTVGLSNMKMIADRHRHAACHNKRW